MLIMKWLCKYKKGLYGPFGAILKILAADNGKSKTNKVNQNPTLTCYRFYNINL